MERRRESGMKDVARVLERRMGEKKEEGEKKGNDRGKERREGVNEKKRTNEGMKELAGGWRIGVQ